uniref:Uncharacterized protein n=1 Tax=Aegilops tauschii subsp. strangulata TaxID=200361 RepID=A0A453FHS1_AEGTS
KNFEPIHASLRNRVLGLVVIATAAGPPQSTGAGLGQSTLQACARHTTSRVRLPRERQSSEKATPNRPRFHLPLHEARKETLGNDHGAAPAHGPAGPPL